jgi:LMBR1 domain-containing protein 1
MYWGGLGYAEVPSTYLQSALFDTTDLETNSLDSYFNFQFYCNRTQIGRVLPLNPKRVLPVNATAPTYTPTIAAGSDSPKYGCESLAGSPVFLLIQLCCKVSAVNNVVVSIGVFIVAVITLVGWLIFSIFGGVGMVALPYDMLNDFKHRARPISKQTYEERKLIIGQQAQILMENCKTLNGELKQAAKSNNFNRRYRQIKNREKGFRKEVLILEYHYKKLEEGYRFQGGNILMHYIKFNLACLSVVLTLLWIVHICIYVIPLTLQLKGQPVTPLDKFLNNMLTLTQDIPIIGICLYALFTFYLLICCIKGEAKLGMRLIFFTIHPLVYLN